MPNWCSNTSAIFGNPHSLKLFYDDMQTFLELEKDNYCSMWEFLKYKGFTEDDLEHKYDNIVFRGSFDSIEYLADNDWEDNPHVRINYDSAWTPAYDELNRMLNLLYMGLESETIAEEWGNEIYVNTDVDGIYFSVRFYVSYSYDEDNGWESETEYFDTEEEALGYLKEISGIDFKNLNEVNSSKYSTEIKKVFGNDGYLCVGEYSYD